MKCLDLSPVDAVITWVDGADPVHKAKLDTFIAQMGGARPRAANPSRFHNSNEIEYCVTSLLKFASWIRTIYIVSDSQQPEFMKRLQGTLYESRVKIVDHSDIFRDYESVLPTFNIRSIMTVLWRIPGLAENFIFLNDDFALIRPVKKEDFFRDNKVVIRGRWVGFSDQTISRKLVNWWRKIMGTSPDINPQERVRHLAAQEYSAKLAGMKTRYYQLQHNPHPWRRSTTETFFSANDDLFRSNLSFRFRSAEQFISECLAAYLEISNGHAILENKIETMQLKPAEQNLIRLKNKLQLASRSEKFVFVCIQSLEDASPDAAALVIEWLRRHVGTLDDLLQIGSQS
jgi:hypothetical protein